MKFQILDTKGNTLSMEKLDKEAAEFFGVPYEEIQYTRPQTNCPNWYSMLCYTIVNAPCKGVLSWSDVIKQILHINVIIANSFDELNKSIMTYKPYIELYYYWKTKGYVLFVFEN